MRAMVLDQPGTPLHLRDLPLPMPQAGQLRLQVRTCAVCRTDLHILDGELTHPKLPLILGHQIVGVVDAVGDRVEGIQPGDRLGVPWLGWTCGECRYCCSGRENLCDQARFTGYQIDGGYAEYALADARFCFPLPASLSDEQIAPLLCGGLIGYRALRLAGEAQTLGFYGFGSAAHILAQVARYQGREVYAFTRPGDTAGQALAQHLGAVWTGSSDQLPPWPLDAALIFAPVGALVPAALRAVAKGGSVVCAGIHMSEIPAFSYDLLWGERTLRSVANLTRQDGVDFLQLAPQVPVHTTVTRFLLEEANMALAALRHGELTGSAVLIL